MSEANQAKFDFHVIYPQYLDSQLRPKDGRRVSAAAAVPAPTLEELYEAAVDLGFKAYAEPTKTYPRSQASLRPGMPGRVRIQFKAPKSERYVKKSEFDTHTRAVLNDEIPNKLALMRRLCETIAATPKRMAAAEKKHKK